MAGLGEAVVVGIDGGGTQTTACVMPASSSAEPLVAPLFVGKVGSCANGNSVGREAANAELRCAVEASLAHAARSLHHLAALCVCLSGVDTPADERRVEAALRQWLPATTLLAVHNDADAALAAGLPGESVARGEPLQGAVLVAGTGTVALGMRADGTRARASGWGGAFMGEQRLAWLRTPGHLPRSSDPDAHAVGGACRRRERLRPGPKSAGSRSAGC